MRKRTFIRFISVQVLIILSVAISAYCIGSLYGTPVLVDQDFNTKWCTDIVNVPNANTKATDTVCEVTLKDGTALPKSPVAGTFQLPSNKMIQGSTLQGGTL